MTLELLTITGNASDASIHQLHGHRDGLTYTIPLVAEVPAWLIDYPKVNGIPTQEVTVTRTFGGPNKGTTVILKVGALPPVPADLAAAVEHFAPPKVVNIGTIDMSTPLHGEDPDPIMASFCDKILTVDERRELEWLRDLYSRFAVGSAPRKFSRLVGTRFAPVHSLENKFDIRGADSEADTAALTTPIASETRLKGSDVILQIFKGAVLQDQITLIKDLNITLNDHAGLIEFTAHQDSTALIDFIEGLRKGASAFEINVMTTYHDGNARVLVFKDIALDHFKMAASGLHDMVEARFTIRAETVEFLRDDIKSALATPVGPRANPTGQPGF
jgi:hypothetical protein